MSLIRDMLFGDDVPPDKLRDHPFVVKRRYVKVKDGKTGKVTTILVPLPQHIAHYHAIGRVERDAPAFVSLALYLDKKADRVHRPRCSNGLERD